MPNTQKQASFFAVENYVVDDFIFEVGARVDKQRIPIKYDQHVLNAHKKKVIIHLICPLTKRKPLHTWEV